MDLFEHGARKATEDAKPLAERVRPESLTEFAGQEHATGAGTLLRSAIENDRLFSMIFWGPPGCGKTTLAAIIAKETTSHFAQISAVLSGVKEIRAVIEEAKNQLRARRRRTILFVDEIHRFNKAQQDAFLHHVESGFITLIGATTENPSFEVIPALLSRCRVVTLKPLPLAETIRVLRRALSEPERGLGKMNLAFSEEALTHIAQAADGDVRTALNGLELSALHLAGKAGAEVSLSDVEAVLQKKALVYDKSGEEHFNIISAFHKSLRGSDPDAALYWMARMLESGEDPFYIIRRMVRFASEDVGVADPGALTVALNAMEAYRFLGSPEGEGALVEAAVYLATAPKSNSIYTAWSEAKAAVKAEGALPVPLHIRNAPTKMMKEMGYNRGYRYAHDYPEGYVPQEYLPDKIRNFRFYHPTDRGYEKVVNTRLTAWQKLKGNARKSGAAPEET